MTPQDSKLEINIAGFASRLLELRETADRARITAQTIVDRFPGTTVTVYPLRDNQEGQFSPARALSGVDAQPSPAVPPEAQTPESHIPDTTIIVPRATLLAPDSY